MIGEDSTAKRAQRAERLREQLRQAREARASKPVEPVELPDDPALRRRALAVPEHYRAAHVRAMQGKASPRQAIRLKCLDCTCWSRAAVADCESRACPLWRLRPYQREEESARTPPESRSLGESQENGGDRLEVGVEVQPPCDRPTAAQESTPNRPAA